MINKNKLGKPIETCLSAGSDIDNKDISKAKKYLTKNFQNRYNLQPHLTYMICPFPEYNLESIKPKIDKYFNNKKGIRLKLSDLHFEPNRKFFSIPVVGDEIRAIHKDMLNLFCSKRDNCIRKKDLERIENGERTEQDIALIKKYGYFRVLDNFTPHITIGNVITGDENIQEIQTKLQELLANIINQEILINEVHVTFHTDSKIQTEMKEIWGKNYSLISSSNA